MVSIPYTPEGYFVGDPLDSDYIGTPAIKEPLVGKYVNIKPLPEIESIGEGVSVEEHASRDRTKLAKFSAIPPDVLWELAERYGKGQLKYPNDPDGTPNWMKGFEWELAVDALERHLMLWRMGEDDDPEFGDSHLLAVIWHAITLRWMQKNGKGRDFRAARGYTNG